MALMDRGYIFEIEESIQQEDIPTKGIKPMESTIAWVCATAAQLILVKLLVD